MALSRVNRFTIRLAKIAIQLRKSVIQELKYALHDSTHEARADAPPIM